MKVLVTSATHNTWVIRMLAQNGHEVVGVDDRRFPLNIRSRYTKPYYIYPKAEKKGFLSAVISIIKKEEPDVVLPTSGAIIKLFSKHRKEIELYTNILVPDYESLIVANDNKATIMECHKVGIGCPGILKEKDAIAELAKNGNKNDTVKVVIKPRRDVGGAKGLSIVDDVDTFKKNKEESEKAYGKTVIEEYIPGNTESMRTVNLIFDKKSRLAAYFTTKKIRQWPVTGGISALSISTNEWELVEAVLPFFKKWKWQGLAEVEIKIDSRNNKPKLIEINPRFWGYIEFPLKCGVNFPMIACELAKSTPASYNGLPKYQVGIKYIRPSVYVRVIMSDIINSCNKIKSITRILTDLRGKMVLNTLELSDPLPIIAKILLKIKSFIVSKGHLKNVYDRNC